MELIKPIFVKRWITENTYINYVFDINLNNKIIKKSCSDIIRTKQFYKYKKEISNTRKNKL